MVPLTIYTALTIYAMFPMLKNTYSGLIGVNPDIKDAARGCGMTDTQILFKSSCRSPCTPLSRACA